MSKNVEFFITIEEALLRRPDLTANEKLCLAFIKNKRRRKTVKRFDLSYRNMAREMGCSAPGIYKVIKGLVDKGWLSSTDLKNTILVDVKPLTTANTKPLTTANTKPLTTANTKPLTTANAECSPQLTQTVNQGERVKMTRSPQLTPSVNQGERGCSPQLTQTVNQGEHIRDQTRSITRSERDQTTYCEHPSDARDRSSSEDESPDYSEGAILSTDEEDRIDGSDVSASGKGKSASKNNPVPPGKEKSKRKTKPRPPWSGEQYRELPSQRPEFRDPERFRLYRGWKVLAQWAIRYRETQGKEDHRLCVDRLKQVAYWAKNATQWVDNWGEGNFQAAIEGVDRILADGERLGYPLNFNYFFTPSNKGPLEQLLAGKPARTGGRTQNPGGVSDRTASNDRSGSDYEGHQRDFEAQRHLYEKGAS